MGWLPNGGPADETGFHGFALLGFAADQSPPDSAADGRGQAGDLPNALHWIPEPALRRF
ncbi:MAG: hypothetical protein ACM3ST_07325 [Bdellovibrio bacteriovorus]